MSTPTITQQERRRECPICPPFAEMCAHWDGKVLVLWDDHQIPHTCNGGDRPFDYGGYSLHLGSMTPCERSAECNVLVSTDLRPQVFGENAEAARAQFRRREAELLGREA